MDRETRLKRLYFRSSHRGSKETDLILGSYATDYLAYMDDAALSEFETFLEENDNDIWDWVAGKLLPEEGQYSELLAQLKKRYELA
jgi:antitoxin CptB